MMTAVNLSTILSLTSKWSECDSNETWSTTVIKVCPSHRLIIPTFEATLMPRAITWLRLCTDFLGQGDRQTEHPMIIKALQKLTMANACRPLGPRIKNYRGGGWGAGEMLGVTI